MHPLAEPETGQTLRVRPAARLLVVDPANRVLLFHYKPASGAHDYWFTPGGAVDPGETFEQAAVRELAEETGIVVPSIAPALDERKVPIEMFSGEHVLAHERYYRVDVPFSEVKRDGWTQEELEVDAAHRWWPLAELAASNERYFPEDLLELIGQRSQNA
jgi:8-oxo-dGTP pyrophosphatase MutT (NUDIX family)